MSENIVATWRVKGIFKADAQKVCDELRDIGEEFTPEQIVERAKDKTLELHKCFTWNNTEAAEKWRLQEARILTSTLVFVREPKEDNEPPIPVRIFNKTEQNGPYMIPERVFKVDDEYQKLLARARAELHAFKLKYSGLTELSEILALID